MATGKTIINLTIMNGEEWQIVTTSCKLWQMIPKLYFTVVHPSNIKGGGALGTR